MAGTIAFLVGVCWPVDLPWQFAVALLLLSGVVLWFFPFLRYLCFFVMGACYCSLRVSLLLSHALPPGVHEVVGVVSGIPERRAGRTVFGFELGSGGSVRLSWYGGAPELLPGQSWRLLVKLRTPRGFRNEGGRDYEHYLLRSGVVATGYVRQSSVNTMLGASWHIDALRYRVGAIFAGEPLLRALGIGDRSLMDASHREVLARTGTAHLLAISGLHIGMVAGLFGFIARMVWWLFPSQSFAAPRCAMSCGVVFAFVYALLAGFTLPTQRALLMLCFCAGALWMGRAVAWRVVLSRALLCVLLFDPLAVAAADFWLSFGAVSAIAFVLSARVAPVVESDESLLRRVVTFLLSRRWLAMQGAVCVAMLPLLLLWFGHYSLVSLPANLIAIPVVSLLLLPLVLFSILLSFWPALAAVSLSLAVTVLGLLWQFLSYLSALPWASVALPQPAWLPFLICCFGVVLLLLPAGVVPRVGGLLCLFALWLPGSYGVEPNGARVVMLDVGQGSAAVVMTQSHTLVLDTGPAKAGGWSAARSVILPFLRSRGRRHIDMLVLSHGDNDHAGGAADITSSLRVLDVRAGGGLAGYSACRRGQHWVWDGVHFSFLHPPDASWQGNDGSCVLRVAAAGKVVLLPGDIEQAGELELLASGADLNADILFVPHHGSRTSSMPMLLQAVSPEYALVSSGCGNRFGFPKKDIMDRYRELGSVMLSTATEGMVELYIAPDGVVSHDSWRHLERRVWYGWKCGPL